MKIEITKELLIVCLCAAVVAQCSFRDAQSASHTIPDIVRSTIPDEDKHGWTYLVWHKVPRASLRHYCISRYEPSCSIVVEDVCHIFAPDTRDGLVHVGRAFVECTYEKRTSANAFEPTAFPRLDKQGLNIIHYWYAARDETIQAACTMPAPVSACFKYLKNGRMLVIIPIPKTATNYQTVGHEVKHLVDGLWHDGDGVSYPGVFVHDRK